VEMGSFSICLLPLFPSCKPNKPVTFEGLWLEVQWEHSHSWSWREELNLQPAVYKTPAYILPAVTSRPIIPLPPRNTAIIRLDRMTLDNIR
jgi:hypothetical protein